MESFTTIANWRGASGSRRTPLQTKSDTEVFCSRLGRVGEDLLDELRGMFYLRPARTCASTSPPCRSFSWARESARHQARSTTPKPMTVFAFASEPSRHARLGLRSAQALFRTALTSYLLFGSVFRAADAGRKCFFLFRQVIALAVARSRTAAVRPARRVPGGIRAAAHPPRDPAVARAISPRRVPPPSRALLEDGVRALTSSQNVPVGIISFERPRLQRHRRIRSSRAKRLSRASRSLFRIRRMTKHRSARRVADAHRHETHRNSVAKARTCSPASTKPSAPSISPRWNGLNTYFVSWAPRARSA